MTSQKFVFKFFLRTYINHGINNLPRNTIFFFYTYINLSYKEIDRLLPNSYCFLVVVHSHQSIDRRFFYKALHVTFKKTSSHT